MHIQKLLAASAKLRDIRRAGAELSDALVERYGDLYLAAAASGISSLAEDAEEDLSSLFDGEADGW